MKISNRRLLLTGALLSTILFVVMLMIGDSAQAKKTQHQHKQQEETSSSRGALSKALNEQFEKLLKSDITNLSYSEQQRALQEQVNAISKITKNQADLQVAWKSLDGLEAKIKKEYMENNKKVIIAHAKLVKTCRLLEHYKRLVKNLNIEIVKIKLTVSKKTKITKSYHLLVKKYKLELKKAFEIYTCTVRIHKEFYREYIEAKKEMSKQISMIKLQLHLIEMMKKKLYSSQGLEIEITKLVEEWEHIIQEEEIEYVHEKEKCHCPIEYRPVCGVNGLTYGSACTARCADTEIHYYGACKCIPQEVITIKQSILTEQVSNRD